MLIARSTHRSAPYEIHRVKVFGVIEYQGRTTFGSRRVEIVSNSLDDAIRRAYSYIRTRAGMAMPSQALKFV